MHCLKVLFDHQKVSAVLYYSIFDKKNRMYSFRYNLACSCVFSGKCSELKAVYFGFIVAVSFDVVFSAVMAY